VDFTAYDFRVLLWKTWGLVLPRFLISSLINANYSQQSFDFEIGPA